MPESDEWIKHTLTELRKLDRPAQRSYLEQVLGNVSVEEREALRGAIQTRQAKVQAELRIYQTRQQVDAARKIVQKEAMLARYHWLLRIIDQFKPPYNAG